VLNFLAFPLMLRGDCSDELGQMACGLTFAAGLKARSNESFRQQYRLLNEA